MCSSSPHYHHQPRVHQHHTTTNTHVFINITLPSSHMCSSTSHYTITQVFINTTLPPSLMCSTTTHYHQQPMCSSTTHYHHHPCVHQHHTTTITHVLISTILLTSHMCSSTTTHYHHHPCVQQHPITTITHVFINTTLPLSPMIIHVSYW
ncbi:hypothetical protein DPMN_054131 [Dreissena polymorpha]|uniref:Uncharacterized protein n=1 Tax=Dreissena polymorpha TaxID=45954 RepID=A0A9D4CPC7_DREPO|nr:hypothetical protein DPMN_054131 [Dreissena polymorpha]